VYLVGGALCKHETKDYDLAIFCPLKVETVEMIMIYLRDCGAIDTFKYHKTYEGQEDDIYHSIYNVVMDGIKFDFLFVNHKYKNIDDVLERFPLSIQRRAEQVDGIIQYGKGFQENPIIVYVGGGAEDKYRKYYPDAMFVNPNGIEREVIDWDIRVPF
jgi:hypothetical protein